MTRNLITELVIRLLAIWFFIKLIATLLPILIYYKDDGKSFLVNLALFIALFGITILIIFFAERISKLIWMDRRTTDEIIDESVKDNILVPLISIVGLYFTIDSLAFIIHSLADVFVILPRLYGKEDSYLYPISRILYQCLFLIFGILLFSFPEKLINIRDDIKKILKREKINYDNLEDE
jgi:hypothetical protein